MYPISSPHKDMATQDVARVYQMCVPAPHNIYLEADTLSPGTICTNGTFRWCTAFMKVCSALCILPYSLHVDNDLNKITLTTATWRKIVAAIFHAFTIFHNFRWCYYLLTKASVLDNPVQVYGIATSIAYILSVTTFLQFAWFKTSHLENIVHWCFKHRTVSGGPCIGDRLVPLWILFFGAFLFSTLLIPVLDICWETNCRSVYKNKEDMRLYYWQLGKYFNDTSSSSELEYLLSLFAILNNVIGMTVDHAMTYFLPSFPALLIYIFGKEVQEFLRSQTSMELNSFLEFYEEMIQFLASFNAAFSSMFFAFAATTMVYFSVYLMELYTSGLYVAIFVWALVITGLIWILAAEGNSKMETIARFLMEHFILRRKTHSSDSGDSKIVAVGLYQELIAKPLGLKAFKATVSFTFLFSILATLITYFVIMLQFWTNGGKRGLYTLNENETGVA